METLNELLASDEKIQALALKEIGRKSLFNQRTIVLLDGLVLVIRRSWVDPSTSPDADVTDQIQLTLEFNGPVTNIPDGGTIQVNRDLVTINCNGMLAALSGISRMIEDAKRVKQDEHGIWRLA